MASLFQLIFDAKNDTCKDSCVLLRSPSDALSIPFAIDLGAGVEALPLAERKPSRIIWLRLGPKATVGPLQSEKSTFIARIVAGGKKLTTGIAVKIGDEYKSRMATDTLLQVRAGRTFGIRNCNENEGVVIELIEFLDLAGLASDEKPARGRRRARGGKSKW